MGFRQDLEEEPVSSLPLRNAIMVHRFTLVRAAVAVMRNQTLGCAVIVDNTRAPEGIFTERSVIDVLVKGDSLDDSPVGDYLDPQFVCVNLNEPIMRVWEAVHQGAARFVCVTDDEGRLIGLTGQRGIAEYVADYFAQQVTVQRLGAKPWIHQREGA